MFIKYEYLDLSGLPLNNTRINQAGGVRFNDHNNNVIAKEWKNVSFE